MTVSRHKGAIAAVAALSALLAAALGPAPAGAEAGHELSLVKSSSMTTNATNTINGQSQPATLLALNGPRLVVRSVALGDLAAGESIEALAEVEVTNDLVTKDQGGVDQFHDIGAGTALVIAGSPTATSGIEVAEDEGTFVTQQMHHWVFERSGNFTAGGDLSGMYLNLVMWSYGSDQISSCWTFPRAGYPSPQEPRQCGMDVFYDHGHLSALRTAPAGSAPAGADPFSVADFSGPSVPAVAPADVPIRYGSNPVEYIVALSRPVGTLEQGDILAVHSELEADGRDVVRSVPSCNVLVATQLFLAPNPDSLTGAAAIGDGSGDNLTGRGGRQIKVLERAVVPSSTTFVAGHDYATPMHVVLRVWTAGNTACEAFGNGIRVKLSQPESFLRVTRYRPEAQPGLVSRAVNSGDDSERATELDAVGETPVSVYSQRLDDLAPGDLLQATGEAQASTSDQRAAVHGALVLADSPDATTGTALGADNFTELSPYNAPLPVHHSGALTVPDGITGERYVNLVMWAEHLQALDGVLPGPVAIDPDAGRLLVRHLRPVDDQPPDSSIAAGPAALGSDTTPEFSFASSEANSSFECRLDSALEADFEDCAPGFVAPVLGDGSHSFQVRALDRAGNADPTPAARAFAIDATAPQTSIVSGPRRVTAKRSAGFAFGSSEGDSSFECSLDGSPFEACGASRRFKRLRRGGHKLGVRATDPLGNVDASPALRSWRIRAKKHRRG